nr:translation initiation factor IF-2-like [Aegilops tauschii subsp. strangulata]
MVILSLASITTSLTDGCGIPASARPPCRSRERPGQNPRSPPPLPFRAFLLPRRRQGTPPGKARACVAAAGLPPSSRGSWAARDGRPLRRSSARRQVGLPVDLGGASLLGGAGGGVVCAGRRGAGFSSSRSDGAAVAPALGRAEGSARMVGARRLPPRSDGSTVAPVLGRRLASASGGGRWALGGTPACAGVSLCAVGGSVSDPDGAGDGGGPAWPAMWMRWCRRFADLPVLQGLPGGAGGDGGPGTSVGSLRTDLGENLPRLLLRPAVAALSASFPF